MFYIIHLLSTYLLPMYYKIENKMTPKSLTNEIWHKIEKKESESGKYLSTYILLIYASMLKSLKIS